MLAIALLCLAAPVVLIARPGQAAEDSTGKLPVTLLSVVDGYGRGMPFKVPAGVWFDAHRGEIYVADRGNHKIAVFDKEGLPLRSFLHYVSRRRPDGTVVLQPGEPKGLAVNSRGDIYLIDGMDDALEVLDYRGRHLARWRAADLLEPEEGDSPPPGRADTLTTPAAVAVDGRDRVYVATTGRRCQIVVLDPEGRVLRRFGRRGREPGAFLAITGISVDGQGRILVTDAQGMPVQCFSPEGELLVAFGKHAMGAENFSLPAGAVRDGGGDIWVLDTIRQVLRRYDPKGELLSTIGGLGAAPGQMHSPVAVAGDGDRLIVVVEKDGARFQVFQVVS
jgi:sugar lactone lactonase YvrE